ncbi:unnamed protein product [Linum tenue]|uniref:Multidrug and toxic compound extrusion protein n=1 Tax=Linum tenue TaxID=586396 RepID=A0AAV0KIM2_9ROSI|nr:unnamed protein product [Linum tenue]
MRPSSNGGTHNNTAMEEEAKLPLLQGNDHAAAAALIHKTAAALVKDKNAPHDAADDIVTKVWTETKKLWHIVGPAIFSRLASYSMLVITQAFAGHLGDLELAGISIANNVIVGFDFGLLLGMASALETLCGQAYGAKKYYMMGVYMQRSWIVLFICGYAVWGGCPLTWTGFSMEAFSGLWDFAKLSAASGVMLCLENWYYRILILMTGNLKNAEIAVDALSICMTINGWEMMIPFAFFAGTGVRVANELGAGNGKGARFATMVSVVQSVIIGLFFWLLIIIYDDKYGWIFTNSKPVLDAVNQLSILLAFTVLLNSVQPILSGFAGVAVGSGWQKYVAYINLGCYYLVGVPLGFLMGWGFDLGVKGIWAGMIFGGTAFQTLILAIITIRCDWDKEVHRTRHISNLELHDSKVNL